MEKDLLDLKVSFHMVRRVGAALLVRDTPSTKHHQGRPHYRADAFFDRYWASYGQHDNSINLKGVVSKH